MTLKIRGESEFTISTTRDTSEILEVVRRVLGEFQAHDDSVSTSDVSLESDHCFQIELTLREMSYAEAGAVMDTVMDHLRSALVVAPDDKASSFVPGATELVPA